MTNAMNMRKNYAAKLDAEIIEDFNTTIGRYSAENETATEAPEDEPMEVKNSENAENSHEKHFDVQCLLRVNSKQFLEYYFILLFLLCFATPVLITTSLNVFIHSAVHNTTYEVIISYVHADYHLLKPNNIPLQKLQF